MKIAILGTRGVPNYYGGFEQFAEFFSVYLVEQGHEVYCYNSHDHPFQEKSFHGVNIIHQYDPEYKLGTFGQFIEADFGIVKYRNDGTLIWDRRYANTAGSDDILKDMAIDSIGNVYVTGWETANFSTNYNFMTVSYDSSGVFRYELIWSESVGVGPDYGKKIRLDANGNIYIAGDATDNCDGNAFVNGFRWDFQVNKYGPNSSVGFNESTESNPTLIIMPNPSNGLARVQWENETRSKAVIRVVDAAGRRIHESESNDEFLLLNTGNWSKGTYIVSVFIDDVIHHDRLVVY